jgi:hypothetical protein
MASSLDSHDQLPRLQGQLFMLRQTVVFPYESVDQLIAEHGGRSLGDPHSAGTGAWHLRHIVEIFRLHARTAMLGLGEVQATIDALIPEPEASIPMQPKAARDALLADMDAFVAWVSRQSPDRLARRFTYGSETDLEQMLVCMSVHVTWHAAAVHYWVKWKLIV